MVFLSGPRQVGKTTLALQLIGTPSARYAGYLSWDDVQARPLIPRDRKPMMAVEAKGGDREPSPAIRYFRQRTSIPRWYPVHAGAKDVLVDGVRLLPLEALCEELDLP